MVRVWFKGTSTYLKDSQVLKLVRFDGHRGFFTFHAEEIGTFERSVGTVAYIEPYEDPGVEGE